MRTRLALAAVAAILSGWLKWEAVSAADGPNFATWESYLGGADSTQYSSLKQIDKTNVKQLQVAWTWPPKMINGKQAAFGDSGYVAFALPSR